MSYWDRPTLKARAKGVLSGGGSFFASKTLWTSVLVMFVYSLLSGAGGGAGGRAASGSSDGSSGYGYSQSEQFFDKYGAYVIIGVIVVILLSIVWSIFVANVLTVGKNRYFLDTRAGGGQFGTLFSGFKGGKYMTNVKSMFAMTIRVVLWSLLFIIPGIIKAFEYYMVPYILAENPDIDPKRALEISSRTTNGEKGAIFVLSLSFIGWYIVGSFACGLGVFIVSPYQEATFAELFGALRYKAEKEGFCAPGEIGVEPVAPAAPPAPVNPVV